MNNQSGTMIRVRSLIILFAFVFMYQKCQVVESAKIICIYPLASKSHMNVFFPLAEALARAGHEVTSVASFEPPSKPHPNHKLLVIINGEELIKGLLQESDVFNTSISVLKRMYNMATGMSRAHEIVMNTTFIQKFCRKEYDQYDLAITSAILNTFNLVCIRENGIPFIHIQPSKLDSVLGWANGVPMPFSYIPMFSTQFPSKMNLWQRATNTLAHVFHLLHTRLYLLPKFEEVARRMLPVKDFPSFAELERNVSLVFVNTHLAVEGPLPRIPHVIDIGGLHCRPAKPLTKDLEDFVRGSGEHGFILFSLGSTLQGSGLPNSTRQTFLDVFSKLKQRVLWKFEEELENLPSNVLISKWLPQQDLLGHPQCKLFITHGGMLSIQEAIYHGVPLLGVPVWLDQGGNIMSAVETGFAESFSLTDINEQELSDKINLIINDQSYYEKVKHLSAVFRDRPLDATATAIYWVEYVLRFKGAPHLKNSASIELNAFQYLLLDVLLLYGVTVMIFFSVFMILYKLCRRRFSKRKPKINLKKKKN